MPASCFTAPGRQQVREVSGGHRRRRVPAARRGAAGAGDPVGPVGQPHTTDPGPDPVVTGRRPRLQHGAHDPDPTAGEGPRGAHHIGWTHALRPRQGRGGLGGGADDLGAGRGRRQAGDPGPVRHLTVA